MARIRSIKPEFWTSEQVMECSTNARLLFIGLWNFCDDAGRHPVAAKQIKALVFPSDDFTADDVMRMIDELSSNGLVSRYTVDGKEYLQVTGWHHQKIDRPQKPKHPGPIDDGSSNGRDGKEGIGEDRKGEEEERGGADAPTAGYAFVGRVGKVKQSDLDRWASSFHAVPDIIAELRAADAYYAENPTKDGKWFFQFSQWLKREHDKRLAEKAAERAAEDRIYAGAI